MTAITQPSCRRPVARRRRDDARLSRRTTLRAGARRDRARVLRGHGRDAARPAGRRSSRWMSAAWLPGANAIGIRD